MKPAPTAMRFVDDDAVELVDGQRVIGLEHAANHRTARGGHLYAGGGFGGHVAEPFDVVNLRQGLTCSSVMSWKASTA